jgi:hypothetical protein
VEAAEFTIRGRIGTLNIGILSALDVFTLTY